MPRPRKFRKVCCLPRYDEFRPTKATEDDAEPVILTVDEYETVRLIDTEGFSQEECGKYMRIARATVQQIYAKAREKLATALVNGRPLLIRGGDYCLCAGDDTYCGCRGCHRHRHGHLINKEIKEDEEK